MNQSIFSNLTDKDLIINYARQMLGKVWDTSEKYPVLDNYSLAESEITKVILRYPKEKGKHKNKLIFYIEQSNGRIGEYICNLGDMWPQPGHVAVSDLTAHAIGDHFIPRVNFLKPNSLKSTPNQKLGKIQFTDDLKGIVLADAFRAKLADQEMGYPVKGWEYYVMEEENKLDQYHEFKKNGI